MCLPQNFGNNSQHFLFLAQCSTYAWSQRDYHRPATKFYLGHAAQLLRALLQHRKRRVELAARALHAPLHFGHFAR
jgi:hypothetical protein